jgi:RNA polymerase sigma-70 factor (ECF subfamily)
VQEAFCRLAAAEPAPENPVAWLYRVCRNVAEKQRRTDQRRVQRERAWSELHNVGTSDVDPLEIAETLAAVESLDDELREALVARVWGQLSLEEVAQLCGVSTATAFRRYHAALQALRAKLTPKSEKR